MNRVDRAVREADVMAVPQRVAQEALELAAERFHSGQERSRASAAASAARSVAGRHRLMPGPVLLAMQGVEHGDLFAELKILPMRERVSRLQHLVPRSTLLGSSTRAIVERARQRGVLGKLRSTLLALALALLAASPAAGECPGFPFVIFADGFESGDTSAWTSSDDEDGCCGSQCAVIPYCPGVCEDLPLCGDPSCLCHWAPSSNGGEPCMELHVACF